MISIDLDTDVDVNIDKWELVDINLEEMPGRKHSKI